MIRQDFTLSDVANVFRTHHLNSGMNYTVIILESPRIHVNAHMQLQAQTNGKNEIKTIYWYINVRGIGASMGCCSLFFCL